MTNELKSKFMIVAPNALSQSELTGLCYDGFIPVSESEIEAAWAKTEVAKQKYEAAIERGDDAMPVKEPIFILQHLLSPGKVQRAVYVTPRL